MKLTPVGYLYISKVDGFKEKNKKEPNDDQKLVMMAESKYEYEHASVHDKLIIERYVNMMNDINYLNDEERKKKTKQPKLKCKCKK